MNGSGRAPELLVFDVNETLSDMSPLAGLFAQVGAVPELARAWFAGLLRDGFALTVHGANPVFAEIARELLRQTLAGTTLDRDLEDAADHIMRGLPELQCHPDVVPGIRALAEQDIRLVTLSNGATSVAETLLAGAGIRDQFERLLSVEDAPTWKPDARAYVHALDQCQVEPTDAMLVAAHPWDTDGARRAGLSAAWVNRGSVRYPAHFLAPDVEVASLVDLAAAFG